MGFLDALRMGTFFRPQAPGAQQRAYDPNNDIFNMTSPIFHPQSYNRMRPDLSAHENPTPPTINQVPNRLQQISNQANQRPMNTVYDDKSMTDYQKAQIDLAKQTLGVRGQELNQRTTNAENRLTLDQSKQKLNEWKAAHPNMRVQAQKGGNFFGVNPTTGETIDLGIPTGEFTDAQDYAAKLSNTIAGQENAQSNTLEAIGARGTEQRKTNEASAKLPNKIIQVKDPTTGKISYKTITPMGQTNDINVNGEIAGLGTGLEKPISELDKSRGVLNRLDQLLSEHPEYTDFVDMSDDGRPRIKEPGQVGGVFGYGGKQLTPELAKQLNDILYGNSTTVTNSNPPTVTPKTGDVKTFPNGRKARYDGKGWIAIE